MMLPPQLVAAAAAALELDDYFAWNRHFCVHCHQSCKCSFVWKHCTSVYDKPMSKKLKICWKILFGGNSATFTTEARAYKAKIPVCQINTTRLAPTTVPTTRSARALPSLPPASPTLLTCCVAGLHLLQSVPAVYLLLRTPSPTPSQ